MPYRSEAQRRYVNWKAGQGEGWAQKFAAESNAMIRTAKKKGKYRKPPERVTKSAKGWLQPLAIGTIGGALANQMPQIKRRDLEKLAPRKRAPKKGQVKKMLVPVSDDPDFNQEAAQRAFDLVMKMDDDTAEMFCHVVVSDYFEETVEKNLGTLQRHLNQVIGKQVGDLKQAHLRMVAKGYDRDQAIGYAQAIALLERRLEPVSKIGAAQRYGYQWREEDFRRDPSSGRFRTKISHQQQELLRGKTGRQILGIQTPKEHNGIQLSREDRVRFQDEYRQLANFLDTVKESTGGSGNQSVMLHFRDRNGKDFTQLHVGSKPPVELLADPSFRLVGADAKPTTLTAGGAAFGLATALGGTLNPQQVAQINAVEGGAGGAFTRSWLESGKDDKASNAKLYGRLSATGDFLSTLGPEGSKTQMAGKFAQIIGNAGPQAEAVLGPTARKTAYRYRGTEKTPDRALVRAYGQGVEQGKQYGPAPEPEIERAGARQRPTRGVAVSTGAPQNLIRMAERRAALAERAPEWAEREIGRRNVVDYLRTTRKRGGRAPDKGLYQLHLAAGNTPPSEGVIINADGQITTQAVGYGDDHYLPFNLKNLKALKGGEYIRTRSVGGLTAEDIYTGLISGARQVTVTSRSGTYTMTFEPDFRGGRRHNDKARRMTRRYEQLLDAVQSAQVERGEIDPDMRVAIENEVKEEMSGPGWRRADIQEAILERIEEFKENPYISEQDEKRAEVIINSRAAGANESERNKIRGQVYDDLMDQKETRFRLNSEGYRAALFALAEQFPYYITTRYASNRDAEKKIDTERDLGYVEPGRNRPSAAAAGLFGGAQTPKYTKMGGKFSAREADYQGGRQPTGPRPAETEESGVGAGVARGKNDVHQKRREENAKAKIEESIVDTALELQQHARVNLDEASQKGKVAEALAMTADDLRRPEGQRKFAEWADQYTKLAGFDDYALKRKWETAIGHRDRRPFDRESAAGIYPKQAPTFTEDPYKLGADKKLVSRELDRIDRKSRRGIKSELVYSQMSEADFEAEHRALRQMYNNLKADPSRLTTQDLEDLGVDPRSPGLGEGKKSLRENPEAILDQMELLQRSRALLTQMNESDRTARKNAAMPQQTNPTPTSEEQAKPKVNVDRQIAWAQAVAERMEREGEDPEESDAVRNVAAMWKQNRSTILSNNDFAAFNETDTMKPWIDKLNQAAAKHKVWPGA